MKKTISSIDGSPKTVKKLRSGQLLIECERKTHSDNLLKMSKIAGITVEVRAHPFLNSSKGIIKSRDLELCTEEEIAEELKDQGVTSVYRIKIRKDKKIIETSTLILTFNKPEIPKEIKAGFLNIKVEIYIPNPMRCNNCQKFGHLKKHCKKNEICPRCGEEGHTLETCTETAKCINCKGNHLSFSKSCPRWLEEKEIQKIKTLKKINYQEAKKQIQSQKSVDLMSERNYAGVLKGETRKQTQHVETQTEEIPELFYKDRSGVFRKWVMKESIISEKNRTITEVGESLPEKDNKKDSPVKDNTKSKTKLTNQEDLKTHNKKVEEAVEKTHKDKVMTDLISPKVKIDNLSNQENPEINKRNKIMDYTQEYDMEVIEDCSSENSPKNNRNKKQNKSQQAKSNIIIKTLQKSN